MLREALERSRLLALTGVSDGRKIARLGQPIRCSDASMSPLTRE
jgi:hypothetical protein